MINILSLLLNALINYIKVKDTIDFINIKTKLYYN